LAAFHEDTEDNFMNFVFVIASRIASEAKSGKGAA
jgi:hypothetical protein